MTKTKHQPLRPTKGAQLTEKEQVALAKFEKGMKELPQEIEDKVRTDPQSDAAYMAVGIYVTKKITSEVFKSFPDEENLSDIDRAELTKFKSIVRNAVASGFREGCCYEENYKELVQSLDKKPE